MFKKQFYNFMSSIFFLGALLFFNPTNVYAADTWIYSEDRNGNHYEYYLDLDYVLDMQKPGFSVPAKTVKNGTLSNNDRMIFTIINNRWYWKYSSSSMYPSLVNEDILFQKLFDACIPYSKWARQYPR